MLHNMSGGLAVGVGFGSGDVGDALALMLAIGIQNAPEAPARGHERVATLGTMAGVVVMLYLDVALA